MSKRAWVAWMTWAACQAAMAADASPTSADRVTAVPPGSEADAPEELHRSRPSQLEVSTGDRSMDLLLKARIGAEAVGQGNPSESDQAARTPPGAVPDVSRRSAAPASAPTNASTAEREGADPAFVKQLVKSAVGVLGSGERAPARDPTAGGPPDPAVVAAAPVAGHPPDGLLAVPGRFFSFIREHRDWVVSLAVLVAAGVGLVVWRQGRTAPGRHVAPTAHAAHRRHGSRRRRRT